MCKFQSSTCKTVGEKLWTKMCPRTEGWTNRGHGDSSIPPPLPTKGPKDANIITTTKMMKMTLKY